MLPAILIGLFIPLSQLKGIGQKRFESYKRLGCINVRDLIFHLPSSVIKRKLNPDLKTVKPGDHISQNVTVCSHLLNFSRMSKRPNIIKCSSVTGNIDLIYFNLTKHMIEEKFKIGNNLIVSGVVSNIKEHVEITHPDMLLAANESYKIKEFEAIYPATYGLNSRYIRLTIQSAITTLPDLPEWIPDSIMTEMHFDNWLGSVKKVHAVEGEQDLSLHAKPRLRLAFDEILAQQLSLHLYRLNNKQNLKMPLNFKGELEKQLLPLLPFELTEGQKQVLNDIRTDQQSEIRMSRLVQGDVGAGKTVIALIAMLNCCEAGFQSALMAPTELLAIQHYKSIKYYCDQLGVECELLISNLSEKDYKIAIERIADIKARIVIGTHALFQNRVNFAHLGLIVVDEQHRFGVEQRKTLIKKGNSPDFVMMTATPIPRTLEMINYGDMDVSILAEKPKNRKPIVTNILSVKKLFEVIESLEKKINAGEKIYWVCPLVEESEKIDLAHVEERFTTLNKRYPGLVGIVHGKMKTDARNSVMTQFFNSELKILVATTVIEVGVDVSDATIMVIENAERFGLSQLHQLRGRVGRGELQSYCILIYGKMLSDVGRQRLKVMKQSQDGFFLSEQDLMLRGAGDIAGKKQSGFPDFRFFSYQEHQFLLQKAKMCAKYIIEQEAAGLPPKYKLLLALFDRLNPDYKA